jgi:TetR/AcrR family transcriptional regulator, transcriptional repressor for nem operon
MPLHKTSKEQIIKKSLEVFRVKGYYNTKISDLSEACGIEKPHFYYYFKSKQDLMKAILIYAHNFTRKLILLKAYDETKTPEERMTLMMKLLVKLYTNKILGCLFGNTVLETIRSEREFIPVLKAYFDEWFEALGHLFLYSRGPVESEKLAKELTIIIQGSIMMMQLYEDKSYLLRAHDKAIELINTHNNIKNKN